MGKLYKSDVKPLDSALEERIVASTPAAPIDIKLFAQLHNDSRLQGTTLEGSNLSSTSNYLLKNIENLEKNNQLASLNLTPSDVAPLKQDLINLKKYEKLCTKVITEYNQHDKTRAKDENAVDQSIREIADKIYTELETEKMVLFPGGWNAKPKGHAMCYRLEKNSDGSTQFLIFNTGAGLHYHQAKETTQDTYLPVMAYHIPAECPPEAIKHYITTLLNPCIKPSIHFLKDDPNKKQKLNITADKLYDNIIKKILYLDALLLDGENFYGRYTQGQISGTCAMRVLIPVARHAIKQTKTKEFDVLLHRIKLQSIIDFYNSSQENKSLHTPAVTRQLRAAIEKLAVLTNTLWQRATLSDENRNETLVILESMIEKIDRENAPPLSRMEAGDEILKLSDITLKTINSDHPFVLPPEKLSMEASPLKRTQPENTLLPTFNECTDTNDYLKKCLDLCLNHAANKQIDRLLLDIEQILFAIPLDESLNAPFWLHIQTPNDAKIALNHLQSLMALYSKYRASKGGFTLPKEKIMGLLAGVISSHLEKKYFITSPQGLEYYPLINNLIQLLKNHDTNYTAFDPVVDEKYSEINTVISRLANSVNQKANLNYGKKNDKEVIEDPNDYYEINLIRLYDLETTLAGLMKNAELDTMDNARINLYKLYKGELPFVFDNPETKNKIEKILQDFDFHFQVIELQLNFENFASGTYSTVSHSRPEKVSYQKLSKFEEHRIVSSLQNSQFDFNGLETNINIFIDYNYEITQLDILHLIQAQQSSNETLIRFQETANKLEASDTFSAHTLLFTRIKGASCCQIITTLEYFDNNKEKLNNPNYQTLFLLNVFKAHELHRQLERTPNIAEKLVDFVESLVKYNERGDKLDSGGIFAFKLSFYLLNYFKASPNAHFLQHSINKLTQKNTIILSYLNRTPELTDVYLLRFMSEHPPHIPLQINEIAEFLHVVMKHHFGTQQTANTHAYFDNALSESLVLSWDFIKQQFLGLDLIQQQKLITNLLQANTSDLVMPDQVISAKFFPTITIKQNNNVIELDLFTGTKTINGEAFSFLPKIFYTDQFRKLFGDHKHIGHYYKNDNVELAEFAYHDKKYRILIDKDNTHYVQMKVGADWYQLKSKSDLYENKNESIPRHFWQDQVNWWQAITGDYLITDKNHTPFATIQHGQIVQTTPQGHLTDYTLARLDTNHFSQFEAPEFIECWQHKAHAQVRLPRYNLEFELQSTALGHHFICTNNPRFRDYVVIQPSSNVIHDFPHLLTLQHRHNPADKIVLLPKQEFYIPKDEKPVIKNEQDSKNESESIHDEYFKLVFDRTHAIRSEIEKKADINVQFNDTEKYYVYNVNQERISSDNSASCLMLAYIYLAKHQPLQALAQIQHCEKLGGLKGHIEEMDVLMKILEGAPSKTYDESINSYTTPNEPETVAVKLHAVALLTRFKEMNFGSLVIPKNASHYSGEDKTKIKQFFDKDYVTDITPIYQAYWRVRDIIPENMRLRNSQEFSILDTHFKGNTNRRVGYKQARWYELKLIQWQKEKEQLRKKNKTSGTLSAREKLRLRSITERVKEGNPYLITASQVRDTTFIIEPQLFDINQATLTTSFFYQPDSWKSDVSTGTNNPIVMLLCDVVPVSPYVNYFRPDVSREMPVKKISIPADLHAETSAIDFLYSFKNIYQLATSASVEDQVAKQQLRQFLQSTLLFHKNKQTMLSQLAGNLLYVTNHNTARDFPDFPSWPDKYSMNDFFVKMHKSCIEKCDKISLSYATIEAAELKAYEAISPPKRIIVKTHPLTRAKKEDKASAYPVNTPLTDKKPSEPSLVQELNLSAVTLLRSMVSHQAISGKKRSHDDKLPFSVAQANKEFTRQEANKFFIDLQKGVEKNKITEKQRLFYHKILSDVTTRAQITTKLTTHSERYARNLRILEEKLLQDANHVLTRERETSLELAGKQRSLLTLPRLIALYLQDDSADKRLFKEKTQLSDKAIHHLIKSLQAYLQATTKQQQRQRCLNQLRKLETIPADAPEYTQALVKLGQELLAKQHYNSKEHPELAVFEYTNDKFIRPEQVKLILNSTNKILQMPMGGGKTKVVIPNLAVKKANGTNLVVVEVPAATFETNFSDLQAATNTTFGLNAHEFKFNRETDCTPKNLEKMYNRWQQIISNREFMVTTPESIQALELKYLELMEQSAALPSTDETLNQTIRQLENLLLILKNQGDAIIDEVDSNLNTKKELNFTLGENEAIPEDILRTVLQYFSFFEKVDLSSIIESHSTLSLADVMKNNKLIVDSNQWDQVFKKLTDDLIDRDDSPLASIVQAVAKDKSSQALFKEFLRGNTIEVPSFIQSLNEEMLKKVAIIKGELEVSVLTLKKNANEHYGFPVESKGRASLDIAIPYLASNTPHHTAEFGSIYETLNYTIQLHQQPGYLLSLTTLHEFVSDFTTRAMADVVKAKGKLVLEQTQAYKEFENFTGLKLTNVYAENQLDLLALQDHISKANRTAAKDYCLLQYTLSKIKNNRQVLRSNSVNHVSQYRSVTGLTGTPWNYRCYHSKLKLNDYDSLGIEGQTIDRLLSQHSPVSVVKDSVADVLAFMQHHPKKTDLHTLIDVGAWFRGISNEIIAKKLYAHFNTQSESSIQQIIFYNSANILCALNKTGVVELGYSDADTIFQKTGFLPEQCFTYYDQRHTTGTDIAQAANAIGITTFAKDTIARDFLQGAKRMRDLDGTQRIDVLISPDVASGHPTVENWGVSDIMHIAGKNQLEILAELHYQAAQQKMHDVIRNNLLSKIVNSPSLADKNRLHRAFSPLLIDKNWQTVIQQFIHGLQDEKTLTILNCSKTALLTSWREMLREAGITLTARENHAIEKQLEEIVIQAEHNCSQSRKHIADQAPGRVTIIEAEKNKQQDKETENIKELEQQTNTESGRKTPANSYSYYGHVTEPILSDTNLSTRYSDLISLNEMTAQSIAHPAWRFDNAIYISKGYKETYVSQQNFTDQYQKPENFFLVEEFVEYTENGIREKKIKILLLTQEEATNFVDNTKYSELSKADNYRRWIVSPEGNILSGSSASINNPEYHALRGQICFLNGDLNAITTNPRGLSWLKQHLDEKLEYLEKVIFPRFPDKKKRFPHILPFIKENTLLQRYFDEIVSTASVASSHTEAEQLLQLTKKYKLSSEGETYLSFAIKHFDLSSVMKVLNNKNIDSAKTNEHEQTAVGLAVARGEPELITRILSDNRFYPPQPSDPFAWSDVIDYAIQSNNISLLQESLQHLYRLEKPAQESITNHPVFMKVRNFQNILKFGNKDIILFCLNSTTLFFPPIPSDSPRVWSTLLNEALFAKNPQVLTQILDALQKLDITIRDKLVAHPQFIHWGAFLAQALETQDVLLSSALLNRGWPYSPHTVISTYRNEFDSARNLWDADAKRYFRFLDSSIAAITPSDLKIPLLQALQENRVRNLEEICQMRSSDDHDPFWAGIYLSLFKDSNYELPQKSFNEFCLSPLFDHFIKSLRDQDETTKNSIIVKLIQYLKKTNLKLSTSYGQGNDTSQLMKWLILQQQLGKFPDSLVTLLQNYMQISSDQCNKITAELREDQPIILSNLNRALRDEYFDKAVNCVNNPFFYDGIKNNNSIFNKMDVKVLTEFLMYQLKQHPTDFDLGIALCLLRQLEKRSHNFDVYINDLVTKVHRSRRGDSHEFDNLIAVDSSIVVNRLGADQQKMIFEYLIIARRGDRNIMPVTIQLLDKIKSLPDFQVYIENFIHRLKESNYYNNSQIFEQLEQLHALPKIVVKKLLNAYVDQEEKSLLLLEGQLENLEKSLEESNPEAANRAIEATEQVANTLKDLKTIERQFISSSHSLFKNKTSKEEALHSINREALSASELASNTGSLRVYIKENPKNGNVKESMDKVKTLFAELKSFKLNLTETIDRKGYISKKHGL